MPVLVNNVLLERNQIHLLTSYLGLLSCYEGRGEKLCQRPHAVQSRKHLSWDPLRKVC